MAQAMRLHALIADRVMPTEESYWSFYRSVLTGRIRYRNEDKTCMPR
jgi:hypothetical protein